MKMYNLNSRLVSKKYLKLLIKFLKYRNIFDIYNKIYRSTIINDKKLFKYIQNLQRKQIMIKNKAEKMKEYNKKEFYVHTIVFVDLDVDPKYRGKGISTKLWKANEIFFRDNKCEKERISTLPLNKHAFEIYTKKFKFDNDIKVLMIYTK